MPERSAGAVRRAARLPTFLRHGSLTLSSLAQALGRRLGIPQLPPGLDLPPVLHPGARRGAGGAPLPHGHGLGVGAANGFEADGDGGGSGAGGGEHVDMPADINLEEARCASCEGLLGVVSCCLPYLYPALCAMAAALCEGGGAC